VISNRALGLTIGLLCGSLLVTSCACSSAPLARSTPSSPSSGASAFSPAPGCAMPALLPSANPPTAPEPTAAASQVQATVAILRGPNWSATAFGSVWVAAHRSQVLYRVDPVTNKIVASIPLTYRAFAVGFGPFFVGPHGVWAPVVITPDPTSTTLPPPPQLFHVDPVTNNVDRDFASPEEAAGIDTADGLWVEIDPSFDPMHEAGARKSLERLDPVNGKVLTTIDLGPVSPNPRYGTDIAAGLGSLWVVVDDQKVARVDPKTGTIVATIQTPAINLGYGTLAFQNNRLFVAELDATVARIDPATNCVDGVVYLGRQLAPQGTGFGQVGLTPAPEGLYVGFDRGSLALVDPATLNINASVRLDEQDGQTKSTWGFGSIWYPTLGNNSIIRVKALG
jgi:streptogramin lyase